DAIHGGAHDFGSGLALVCLRRRLLHDIGYLLGVLAGAFGELADLLGDDHEALAMLAGPRSLDRSLERRAEGSIANRGDHPGDLVDLAAALSDRVDDTREAFDRGEALLHQLGGVARFGARGLGVVRYALECLRRFVQRESALRQRGVLRSRAIGDLS